MRIEERYQSYNDAQQQLHNTYVELDGELALIQYKDGWDWFVARTEKDKAGEWKWGEFKTEDIRPLNLNLEPLKLGYVNFGNSSAYIERKPLRKWKQGIYPDYLELVRPGDAPPANGIAKRRAPAGIGELLAGAHAQRNRPLTIQNVFKTSSVIDMYKHNYPTFVRAFVELALFQVESRAWSKEWAFRRVNDDGLRMNGRDITLEYKGKRVGLVVDGKAILYAKYKYLTETFVEAMIHAT